MIRLPKTRLSRELLAVLGIAVLVACHLVVAVAVTERGDEAPAATGASTLSDLRLADVATVDEVRPGDVAVAGVSAADLDDDVVATVEFEELPPFNAVAPTAAPPVVPTVALMSGRGPAPTPTAKPTRAFGNELLPTVSPGDVRLLGIASAVQATPTPVYHQVSIPGTDVKLRRQTVFMSQVGTVPPGWPVTENVFYERTARHIGWLVDLDYTAEDPEFEMRGLMRWLNVTGGTEHVIYQQEYVMDADSAGNALFFMLGKDVPGFWYAGDYRLELWDNRDRLAVYYEFKVKSGVLR